LTKKQPEDAKLLMLPSELVDRLRDASNKKGTSLTGYATEVLEEALRAEKLGAPLGEAVEAYRMGEIHRGAGAMMVPRSSLGKLIEDLRNGRVEDLPSLWEEAGRWYGRYLTGKLTGDEVIPFLRRDLLASWNLDEVEISDGDDAVLRFTGFEMSEEFTNLLLSYVHGLMESLGYAEVGKDSLRGMATIKYIRHKS
jgi:hypothetical protein